MKTVFVVTSGSYSDYQLRGIFSTEEKANEFIDRARASEDCYFRSNLNEIEERDIDSALEERQYQRWIVYINLRTGALVRGGDDSMWGSPRSLQFVDDVEACGISHKSAGHALKLAAEARQEHLRKSAMVPN